MPKSMKMLGAVLAIVTIMLVAIGCGDSEDSTTGSETTASAAAATSIAATA